MKDAGPINEKHVVSGLGTHAQCALEVCPSLNASLACVPDNRTGQLLGKLGWIGLYQRPGAFGAKDGWDSWTSGCDANFPVWRKGEPNGEPELESCAAIHDGAMFAAPCWEEKPSERYL